MLGALVVVAGIITILIGSIVLGVIRTQLRIRSLGSPKRHVRERARSWLLMEGRSATRLLVRSLRHDNAAIRRGVAEVLGMVADSRVTLPLLDALQDKDKTVRWEIITALGRLRELPAVERLINISQEPDKESRRRSIEALGNIGGIEVIDVLTKALHDEDAGVRKNAVMALASQQRVPPLVDMLRDPNADVRLLTAETLAKHRWRPQNDSDRIAYDIAWQKWSSPILTTPAAVDPLLMMLQDERPENMNARINAAMALGKIGEAKAFEPLVRMCRHIETNVRATAVTALGDLKDPLAISVLVQTLKDTAPTVRAASATALGQLEDPRSIEALIQALGDTDPARLGDRNPEVQRAAASALKKMPGERVTATLVHALEDDDAIVRYEAAEVLIQRGWAPENAEDTIRATIARDVWESLKTFGAEALPFLIVRSTDKDRNVRENVAALLTELLSSVTIVVFGNLQVKASRKRITFKNPDVEALTLPMEHLKHLVVHIPTFDFHALERFLTYAINHIGQQYLRQHVIVHLYGEPTDLHPNLRNTLNNLCKEVKEHAENQ
jgi:HEAT repeat protein